MEDVLNSLISKLADNQGHSDEDTGLVCPPNVSSSYRQWISDTGGVRNVVKTALKYIDPRILELRGQALTSER